MRALYPMRVIPHPFLEGQWLIKSPGYSSALVTAGRGIPGMRWDATEQGWSGYVDAVDLCIRALRHVGISVQGEPISEECEVTRFGEAYANLYTKKRRGYQLDAAEFLLREGPSGALLGDAMGLGKTCSALTAARAVNGYTVVVCPSYVRGVWWNPTTGGELKKWWPIAAKNVFLPTGVKGASHIPPQTQVVVVHYDIIHAWVDALVEWAPRIIILDEAHLLQSEGSRRSNAVRHVASTCEYRWGLTGTPLTNRVKDLWNVVDTLSPGRFGKFFDFGVRYCDAHKEAVTPTKTVWKFDGKSNLEELAKRLEHFSLRRTAKDVALELPPKTRQMVWVEVPKKARMVVDVSTRDLRKYLDAAADAKLEDAWAAVEGHLEAGHKVVAFTYRRSVAEWLATRSRLGHFATSLVHGGVSHARRGKALSDAKEAPGASLLTATIDSSSTGIDLSYADVAVFVELDWKPHALLQAEARLHRFGQANPVLVQYILARGTTDELIAHAVVGKLDTFESVVGTTGESLAKDLSGSDEDVLSEIYASIGKMQADSAL